MRPDAKSQVTAEYKDGKLSRIDAVVISTQHSEDVDHKTLESMVVNDVVKTVIPSELLDENTKYHINPTGRFVIGGPQGDCGLTGRKTIVDTYGGHGAHVAVFVKILPKLIDQLLTWTSYNVAVAAGFTLMFRFNFICY